jgi:hypothetical protein
MSGLAPPNPARFIEHEVLNATTSGGGGVHQAADKLIRSSPFPLCHEVASARTELWKL